MKKLLKVILVVAAAVGCIAGILYLIERKRKKDELEDFDDEDFDDVFSDSEDDNRDYVTLDFEETEE